MGFNFHGWLIFTISWVDALTPIMYCTIELIFLEPLKNFPLYVIYCLHWDWFCPNALVLRSPIITHFFTDSIVGLSTSMLIRVCELDCLTLLPTMAIGSHTLVLRLVCGTWPLTLIGNRYQLIWQLLVLRENVCSFSRLSLTSQHTFTHLYIQYNGGNFQGRKLTNFAIWRPPTKVFFTKFWVYHTDLYNLFSILWNAHFLLIHQHFLPLKFPTIHTCMSERGSGSYDREVMSWFCDVKIARSSLEPSLCESERERERDEIRTVQCALIRNSLGVL